MNKHLFANTSAPMLRACPVYARKGLFSKCQQVYPQVSRASKEADVRIVAARCLEDTHARAGGQNSA